MRPRRHQFAHKTVEQLIDLATMSVVTVPTTGKRTFIHGVACGILCIQEFDQYTHQSDQVSGVVVSTGIRSLKREGYNFPRECNLGSQE